MTDLFSLESYHYDLPEERIAQEPPKERGQSRLMVLDRSGETPPVHARFAQIADYLPANALLVANNSRVVPARLAGRKPSGGKAEMLLMTPAPLLEQAADKGRASAQTTPDGMAERSARAEALLKPSKSIRVGDVLEFGEKIRIEVLRKGEFGQHEVQLFWRGSLVDRLEEAGKIPLPPYIRRPQGPDDNDRSRYQTVYARRDQSGSVAAPTAGLHFTPKIRENLLQRGFGWAEVTLHVGYGTFSPVREEDIRSHPMHAEYVEIPEATAQAVLQAKAEARPVIAVGTTSARSLEGMAREFRLLGQSRQAGQQTNSSGLSGNRDFHACGEAPAKAQTGLLPGGGCFGQTDIFIYPGYEFQVLDGLITNFHLPGSSLLMLVCALAGYDGVMAAYAEAVRREYRFFSYGDAMLIR